jgi:protein-tyrosine kinase
VGKISKALDKYASERKGDSKAALPAGPPLTYEDIQVLVGYDEKTGHLLQCNSRTGLVDEKRIDELRARGTILRLLENQLIFPGGKLTARGFEEARRLSAVAAAIPSRLPAPAAERDNLAQGAELSDGQAILSKPEPEPKAEPVVAVSMASAEPEKGLAEPPTGPLSTQSAGPPLAVVPRPLKVVPETRSVAAKSVALSQPRPVAEVFGDHGRPPVWDEAAIDCNLVALTDPHSPEAEQFKILRTNILFPLAGNSPRSILLTSAAPGEGKTFAAANLAISIALNINRHVLLIDADMRQPQLHKRFGFGSVPGLSDYLADDRPLQSLLLKTKVDKLTLLPAGPPPENPSELIGAERMSSLIAEVANRYPDRIVVIDAPPPALAAETGVLARQVDGIIVVVRYGKTRRDDLADMIARLGEKKILGSIVNFIETAATRYYGYKYGSYGRSSKK